MFNSCPINERNINIFPEQKPEHSTDHKPQMTYLRFLLIKVKASGLTVPVNGQCGSSCEGDHSVTHYGMTNTTRGPPSDQSEKGHTHVAAPHLLTHHQPLRRAMLQLGAAFLNLNFPKLQSLLNTTDKPNPQYLTCHTQSQDDITRSRFTLLLTHKKI